MSRKNRPYHFYDTTGSICSTCFRQNEAKILFKGGKVYMDKWCPQHGTERVLISDDEAYYRLGREVFVKRPEMPQTFNTPCIMVARMIAASVPTTCSTLAFPS